MNFYDWIAGGVYLASICRLLLLGDGKTCRDHDALLEYQGRDEHPEYVVEKRADQKRRRNLKMCKINAIAKPE